MKTYAIVAILLLGSFLAGKYLTAPKIETKEVVKYIEVEKKVEKTAKTTKTTEVKKPDGTIVTEVTSTENTQTNTDRTAQLDSSKSVKQGAKVAVGVLAIANAEQFSKKLEYGVTVSVPVFGNVKAQALGTTDKRVGLGLALEF